MWVSIFRTFFEILLILFKEISVKNYSSLWTHRRLIDTIRWGCRSCEISFVLYMITKPGWIEHCSFFHSVHSSTRSLFLRWQVANVHTSTQHLANGSNWTKSRLGAWYPISSRISIKRSCHNNWVSAHSCPRVHY
jgi:hypothetical protein